MIDRTVLVYDSKLFVELAIRLSRDFSKVYYFSPWETGFNLIDDVVVGDGIAGIHRCNDIESVFDEVDLFIFPDSQHAWLQLLLERMGKRVWGSRRGQRLEQDRIWFRDFQVDLGMDVPGYRICTGIDDLRDYLRGTTDKYVKISKFRGFMETWHHINYELSDGFLDFLAFRAGGAKDQIRFLVDDAIHTDLEDGWDGYCIDGEFPAEAVQGIEIKDKCYLGSVQRYQEMPKELTDVNAKLSPILKEYRYRNFFSSEVRIADGVPFLTDPCCREASPAGECLLELIGNLGDIMWEGSVGDMVQPEFAAKYAAECMIYYEGDPDHWRPLQVPKEIRQWVKLYHLCRTNVEQIVPSSPRVNEVGAVIGLGDTLEEAIDALKENAKALEDQPVTIDTKDLLDALKEIKSAEEHGVEFSDEPVPAPETVIDDA